MQIINFYDNQVGNGCIWNGDISCIRKTLEKINWELVIHGRILIARDINAHSPV